MAAYLRCLLCRATFLTTAHYLHPTHRCVKDQTHADDRP